MFETISNAIYDIDAVIWGWWLIILLFGTHIFMTIRTGFIQRKTLSKGIKLSVTRDPDAEGEVSNFGALTTALAATIGTGNIVGVGTAIALGGPGAVLRGKIPCKDKRRTYAGRCHVCAFQRVKMERPWKSSWYDLRNLRRICIFWYRLCYTG